MEEPFRTINQKLDRLMWEMWELEERLIVAEGYTDLTNNDMHVIEAIGPDQESQMSVLAEDLHITVGSLTTAVNSLVKKGYAKRRRGEEDRRVVFVSLTEKGKQAYKRHEDYQRQTTLEILKGLDKEELQVLIKTMDAVSEFSEDYEGRREDPA